MVGGMSVLLPCFLLSIAPSPARTAVPLSTRRAKRVISRVLVAVFAVRQRVRAFRYDAGWLAATALERITDVFRLRPELQMRGINAAGVVADVANHQPFANRPECALVGVSVRADQPWAGLEVPVAGRMTRANPLPTGSVNAAKNFRVESLIQCERGVWHWSFGRW
jgi:hypothetical protein